VLGESQGILERAEAGIQVEPENAEQLALAISKLANRPDLCQKMAGTGRKFVSSEFDRKVLASRMLDQLRKVAQS
jgi:glycosyltransferase involved in cell wall biosynthesis